MHSLQVLRSGDWKFIEKGASYYTWTEQPLQLYNIREDPSEKHNLAEKRPEIVAKLRDRLAYHKQFARQEETPSKIPGGKPATYGQEENARYGEWVRERAKALRWDEQDAKSLRRGKNRREREDEL